MLLLIHFDHILFEYDHLGLDMSSSLIADANSNILRLMSDPPVRLINDDAVNCFKYLESAKLILYAYNPFDSSVLRSTLEPLDPFISILFIYVEPAHADVLLDLGFILVYEKRNSFLETKSRHYSLYYSLHLLNGIFC